MLAREVGVAKAACFFFFFFFQAEDGIRDYKVTGVQTCALPISVTLAARLAAVPATSAAHGSQPGHGYPGHGADAGVRPARRRGNGSRRSLRPDAGAGHRAAFRAGDRHRRTGSGSPSTSTSRFVCWCVRPTETSVPLATAPNCCCATYRGTGRGLLLRG